MAISQTLETDQLIKLSVALATYRRIFDDFKRNVRQFVERHKIEIKLEAAEWIIRIGFEIFSPIWYGPYNMENFRLKGDYLHMLHSSARLQVDVSMHDLECHKLMSVVQIRSYLKALIAYELLDLSRSKILFSVQK